jgi:methanogenic corrinoid protein MtbC1
VLPQDGQLAALGRRFVAAQLEGDRRAALAVVDEGFASAALEVEALWAVVAGAQDVIGRLWQRGSIGVADEHLATAIAQLALARIYDQASPAPRNGHEVVMACVEGERHELPARMAADHLDILGGFDVRHLGADVPTGSLVDHLQRRRPLLLALSVTMPAHEDAARVAVARVRAGVPGLPVAVGGQLCAARPHLADELGVEASGVGPQALLAFARHLAAAGPRDAPPHGR